MNSKRVKQRITLKVNGRDLENEWTEIRVTRSLDEMCPSFEFYSTQKKPFRMSGWPVQMGSECTVQIAGIKVITGWVEDVNIQYTKDDHRVVIAGRAKTCDLVDCSRSLPPYDWPNSTPMLTIVQELVGPFGIGIAVDGSASAAVNNTVMPMTLSGGSTIMEGILKLAKAAGVLVNTTVDGDLLFTSVGTIRSAEALKTGMNILAGGLVQSNKERFSEYYVKGNGYGTDQKTTALYANIEALAVVDSLITRYRPLTVLAETETDRGKAEERAKWEAQYRAGNSRLYECTVQGWRQFSSGGIWEPNMIVKVEDNVFSTSEELLINAVEYRQSPTSPGTTTILQLCSPDKYAAEANLDKIKTKFDKGGGGVNESIAIANSLTR